MEVRGDTTKYNLCLSCEQPCDPVEQDWKEELKRKQKLIQSLNNGYPVVKGQEDCCYFCGLSGQRTIELIETLLAKERQEGYDEGLSKNLEIAKAYSLAHKND